MDIQERTGELYSAGGARLAQAVFTNETANGWQTVKFTAPVAITAGTTYVAAFYNPSGFYVADNLGLNTTIVNAPLTAAASGGVFSYGAAPSFPTNVFQASNYWVDPIFSTTASVDSSTEHLSWDAIPGATQYILNYRPNLSSSWITRTVTGSANISALTCGPSIILLFRQPAVQLRVRSAQDHLPHQAVLPMPVIFSRSVTTTLIWAISVSPDPPVNWEACIRIGFRNDIGGNQDQFQYAYTSGDNADYDVSDASFNRISKCSG